MATSRLLSSLHEFQSKFDAFKGNRVRVREIFRDTENVWKRWRDRAQESMSRARAFTTSETVELSQGSDHQDGDLLSRPESQVAFDLEMKDVVKLLEETPTLVFVGQLKSGKSTLANVILQHHILPSDGAPCTARMVKLKPIIKSPKSEGGPSKEYLQILKADGTTVGERQTLETAKTANGVPRLLIPQNVVDVGRESGFKERSTLFRTGSGEATEYGAWVEIYCHHPLLQFIQIVDSPGKGENDSLDQLVDDEVCNGLVQTLVYVIDACRGLTTKDKIDLKWIRNQLTENSRDRGKILFVCTRVDKALQEDEDEPPPTVSLSDLPANASDGEESWDDDDSLGNAESNPEDSNTAVSDCNKFESETSQAEGFGSLQYSTRIHKRVFEALASEGFLKNLEPEQLQSHDQCPLFHCVSAYAAEQFSHESKQNPFVEDFIRFEKCLAEVLVDNLNAHLTDALDELVKKQSWLIESMFHKKFSLAKKAKAAERQLLFILKMEDEVYKQLKGTIEGSRFSKLKQIIREEKALCLKSLPKEAGKIPILVDDSATDRKSSDLAVANQIRVYVSDQLNESFRKRVQEQLPVLNVGETIERCAKSMEDQAGGDLEATRLVSVIVQAAYRPLSKVSGVRQGLPFRLHIARFIDNLMGREPSESYTTGWKETMARDFLNSLKSSELASQYCAGVKETLEKAHTEFKSNIKALEDAKKSIVAEARDQQQQVRIKEGYDLAAVYLQSKSFFDSFVYGVPKRGDKIGEGPTTAVYKCQGGKWGNSNDAIIKARKPWPPPVSREVWPASLYFSIQCLDHDQVQKTIGIIFPGNKRADDKGAEDEGAEDEGAEDEGADDEVADDEGADDEDANKIWVLEERCYCSLEDVLRGGATLDSIPWLSIGKNVIDGMLHLFCQGIPHHNIKPSNVLLTGRREAKLCDMGLCDIANMKRNKVTRAVYFVAPELALSETEGVATTDVYSIGILLWYLLKGYYESSAATTAMPDPTNYSTIDRDVLASEFFQKVCDVNVQLRPEVDQWSLPDHKLRNAAILIQKCWRHDVNERLDCGRLRNEFEKLEEELRQ